MVGLNSKTNAILLIQREKNTHPGLTLIVHVQAMVAIY
jgi:hypothetical protein